MFTVPGWRSPGLQGHADRIQETEVYFLGSHEPLSQGHFSAVEPPQLRITLLPLFHPPGDRYCGQTLIPPSHTHCFSFFPLSLSPLGL